MRALGDIFLPASLPPLTTYEVSGHVFRFRNLPGEENFLMGNNKGEENNYKEEAPKHKRIIHPFALAEYPVTQIFWKLVYELGKERCLKFNERILRPDSSYFFGRYRPVEFVSWDAAKEFCRLVNLIFGKEEGFFRLPSEAEWEYAARAGSRETLHAGSNHLADVGWFDENNEKETMPVGMLSPNTFGLYDLNGNVLEWCEDDWHENYENHHVNGGAWVDDLENRALRRVLRGSSWLSNAGFCRCAYRVGRRPVILSRGNGFRLAARVQ